MTTPRRWVIAALCAVALAALCLYGGASRESLPLKALLANPSQYDGQLVTMSLRIQEAGERYVLRDLYDPVICEALGRQAQDGTHVTSADVGLRIDLRAVFHAPATLEIIEAYVARGRLEKIIASLAAIAWVAALAVMHFRPRRQVSRA